MKTVKSGKFFLTILSFFIFFFLIKPAEAKDFSSFYKTTYEFNSEGTVKVTQEISLVNKTANLYVSEYTLSLVGGNIPKLQAYDQIGPIKTNIQLKDSTTIVTLKFNQKAVGLDKVLSFILKYEVLGLAEKEGNLWRVSIPKLASGQEIDEYELLLKIPLSFGKIAYIAPYPESREEKDKFYYLDFSKNGLYSYGIVAIFGQYQTFDFNLLYELKNETAFPKISQIALPPDTAYQNVYYQLIFPEPYDVKEDDDGNWMADFVVSPKEKIKVEVKGQVNIFSQPKKEAVKKFNLLSEYLKPRPFWETNNEKIKNLAKELKTPEKIFKYVVDNLSYDYQEVSQNPSRKGALKALEEPQKSLCTEFTDLFVALCRAAGIPARELEGFAYTDNPKLKRISLTNDLLHSWPEYFDWQKNAWIAVDPTWANTSGLDFFHQFDMNHFVFVIHGKNETNPAPAGAYKITEGKEETLGKQVYISFGQEIENKDNLGLRIEKISPSKIYSGKNNLIKVVFKNNGGGAIYSGKIDSVSSAYSAPKEVLIKQIPPFGKFEFDFMLKPKEMFKDYQLEHFFFGNNQSLSFVFFVKSVLLRIIIVGGMIISVVLFIIFLSVRKSKNK